MPNFRSRASFLHRAWRDCASIRWWHPPAVAGQFGSLSVWQNAGSKSPVPVSSAAIPVSFGMHTISFQPFIIGVAGGSGSGKSTVSQQVLSAFGADMVSVVMQDDYYSDQTHLTPEVRREQNYDHPNAFEWPLLVQHVEALRNGQSIEMPEYDFTLHNRSNRTISVKPAPVIVIEGLFALYDEALRDMMSLKIFVDTASDVRFIRRMQRDITERGRSVDSVVGQYMETVRPMHKQFIEPTKRNADIIFPHGANGPAVDMIVTKVASIIGKLKRPVQP
jgi:uridine kinase